jgi:carbamoyltransferase
MVNTSAEAYRSFLFTDMDVLVVGPFLLLKDRQPPMPGADDYKRRFRPD